jgi:pimeloyl-ACP methyl ester carboxylesterase
MSDQTLLIVPGLTPGLSCSRAMAQLQPALPASASIEGIDLLDLVTRAGESCQGGMDGLSLALGEAMVERGLGGVIVVAEGIGATTALRLAALRPELVSQLVLCAPYGYAQPLSGSWEGGSSVAATVRDLFLGDEGASLAALEHLSGGSLPSSLAQTYAESAAEQMVARAVRILADWIEDGSLSPMGRADGDRVRSARVPVSLVWGRDDRVAGLDSAFYLNRRLKDVQLRVFSGVGHLVLEEGGARVAGYVGSLLAGIKGEDNANDGVLERLAIEMVDSRA